MAEVIPAKGGRPTTPGAWMVLAAAMLWGTTGTSQALTPAESTPAVIAALRMLLAGSFLLLGALLNGGVRFQRWPLGMTLFAGCLISVYQFSSFWAMAETGVAVGTIVAMGSAPVFAGILEYLAKRKKPSRRWYLSTLLAVTGCLLLLLESSGLQVDVFGVSLALLAGFSYAGYTLTIALLVTVRSPQTVTAVVTFCSALLLLPVLFSADLSWLGQVNGWLPILHLGLIATALSYWLFARGLQTVQASTAVTLTLAEPLVATLLGILVVGERMSLFVTCGLCLIFSALALLVFPDRGRLPGKFPKGGGSAP